MEKLTQLDELRVHLNRARESLGIEKASVIGLNPVKIDNNREAYLFAYRRAETLGFKHIQRRLRDFYWLPMQLDPKSEMVGDKREAMKGWLKSDQNSQPSSDQYGNDFIHALTRTALLYGFEDNRFKALMDRVANLFRDLSCLVGVVYYCSFLEENHINAAGLSDSENLEITARELAILTQLTIPPPVNIPAAEQNLTQNKKNTLRQTKYSFLRLVTNNEADRGDLVPTH